MSVLTQLQTDKTALNRTRLISAPLLPPKPGEALLKIDRLAPYQIKKRNADWGPAEVTRKFNEAQLAFIRRVSDAEKPCMQVKEHAGFEAAQALIDALVAGRIDPKDGHIVVLT